MGCSHSEHGKPAPLPAKAPSSAVAAGRRFNFTCGKQAKRRFVRKCHKCLQAKVRIGTYVRSMGSDWPVPVRLLTKIIPEEQMPIRRVRRLVLDRCVDNFFAETERVAFCTQNIVPGVDFTNGPLLQGRNFSYLDTQLKRLGSPNFTFLPINAPKCPIHTLQQDGHMAVANPAGRVNYEPNSWTPADRGPGPREEPQHGFRSYAAEEQGTKRRVRAETFSDHYSHARQFYLSQTDVGQQHIVSAFTFELSKVETPAIRARMVANLLNVNRDLGRR